MLMIWTLGASRLGLTTVSEPHWRWEMDSTLVSVGLGSAGMFCFLRSFLSLVVCCDRPMCSGFCIRAHLPQYVEGGIIGERATPTAVICVGAYGNSRVTFRWAQRPFYTRKAFSYSPVRRPGSSIAAEDKQIGQQSRLVPNVSVLTTLMIGVMRHGSE